MPIPTSGPPAGNVPLVAWPSVCADHAAGAISSTPSAAPSAIARRAASASAAAADPGGDQQRGQPASSDPGLSRRIATSVADAGEHRERPEHAPVVPPSASSAAPAPTSAAVNGASSET